MLICLDNLDFNKKAYIQKINCSTQISKRLNDLGLLNGTLITPIFKSPFNDPIAYEFRGNIISIRNEDAHNIIVDTNEF